MKRFLMLVGVAVVAAAMYVAAAPGSQQAKGPTAKQFNALKKEVAAQGKTIKTLKTFDGAVASFLTDCVQNAVPINQFGDNTQAQTEGYRYSQPTGAGDFLTTALDVTDTQDTGALFIIGGGASCGTLVNTSALRHAALRAGVRIPRVSSRRWSFTPHH